MAAQVLCYGKSQDWTFAELFAKLEDRFGSEDRADEYLARLETRRRGQKETLQQLCHGIEELVALAYPGPRTTHSDRFAVMSFIRALNDIELAEKVRDERPKTLDEAYKTAQMFESFRAANTGGRSRDDSRRRDRDEHQVMAVVSRDQSKAKDQKEFQKAVEDAIKDLRDQIARLSAAASEAQQAVVMQPGYGPGMMMPMMNTHGCASVAQAPVELPRQPGAARRPIVCFGCGQPGHIRSRCTAAGIQSNDGSGNSVGQGYQAKRLRRRHRRRKGAKSRHYLEVEINGIKRSVILDTGCDRTVVPPSVAEGREVKPTRSRLFGVGGRGVPLIGTVVLEVRVGETRRNVDCLVSPGVEEPFLGLDWLKASEAEWSFGQNAISVGGCRYPLLTSGDLGRPREEALVQTCKVVEPRALKVRPSTPREMEKKLPKPQGMEPPSKRGCTTKTSDEESCRTRSTMSVNVARPGDAEPVTKSDPPAEPTPSVTGALGILGEAAAVPREEDKTDPPAEPTLPVAGVPETVEEAAVKLMRVETDERLGQGEQEWELPDWFQRRQMASMARHAQRRNGMRFGMWGFPLGPRAQESTC